MKRRRVAIIAVRSAAGEVGGAERFYKGLETALADAGVEVDLVAVESNEIDFNAVKESYLRFYDLDLSGYDGVISTKAPSYLVQHSNHVCFLVHTMRVFYDQFRKEFPEPWIDLLEQRDLIHELDTASLSPPRTKKIFCIGHEVRKRLLKYNNLDSEVLHMDLPFNNFKPGKYTHIFLPSRLHRWKRIGLVIEAMKFVDRPVELKIAGTGEHENELKELADGDSRISFLGRISDEELVENYANALVVPFVPVREDLGFVTLEAFRSSKPVITCTDSGEPTHFVQDRISGFICAPEPSDIGQKIELLFDQPKLAEKMGKSGYNSIEHLSWANVSRNLLSALDF